MKKEEIHLSDISRILFGQAPPLFLVEVAVRTAITYLLLLVVVKWLGKRMSGQLTIMEMAVMFTLGAIVSVPMQTPDRGILQGLLLLLCAVSFQRGISYLGFRSHRLENITQGKPSLLVKNGIMQIDQMRKDRISRQQLFSELRRKKIFNLGIVDRVYLEACGLFSIFTFSDSQPGLPLYPPDDSSLYKFELSAHQQQVKLQACVNCGKVKDNNSQMPCQNCEHNQFIQAFI